MKRIMKSLAKKLNLSMNGSTVYGHVNDILYNIRFYRTPLRDCYSNLIERLFAPKYEKIDIDAFVRRKGDFDLAHIGTYLSDHYPIYRAERVRYRNGEMSLCLEKKNSTNIKASYIAEFLYFLSEYLAQNGYYSACTKCGSNEGVAYDYNEKTGICAQCLLKEARL